MRSKDPVLLLLVQESENLEVSKDCEEPSRYPIDGGESDEGCEGENGSDRKSNESGENNRNILNHYRFQHRILRRMIQVYRIRLLHIQNSHCEDIHPCEVTKVRLRRRMRGNEIFE